MSMALNDDLAYQILSVVEEIPYGRVATYGQIARLIGMDSYSRLVGRVLGRAEHYRNYPCHKGFKFSRPYGPGLGRAKMAFITGRRFV